MIKRLITVLIVVALLVGPLTARPSTVLAVSSVTASISPSSVNTATTLTVSFTVANAVPAGGWVSLTLPSFQASTATVTYPVVSISPTVSGLTAYLNSSAVFYLSSPTTTIAAGIYTVTFSTAANIKTPLVTGTYSVTVGTSTGLESPSTYSGIVVGGNAVTGVGAFVSPATVGTPGTYTIYFTTSSVLNALNGPSDTITLAFPSGTTIPASFTAGTVTVNSAAAPAVVKMSSTQVQVTMPTFGTAVVNPVIVISSFYLYVGMRKIYGQKSILTALKAIYLTVAYIVATQTLLVVSITAAIITAGWW